MTLRNFLMGVASSLFATGIAWGITEHNWITGSIIAAAGVAAFVLTYLFTAKPSPPSTTPSIQVNPNISPTFSPNISPVINIGVSDRESEAEGERNEHDRIVLEHIQQQAEHRPYMTYLVADVARIVSLNFHQTDQALKRLFAKGFLYRGPIDADGDFVYWYRGPK